MGTIDGFSFNHLSGVGWYGDLGNLQIMPTVGVCDLRSGSNEFFPLKKGRDGWKSEFSHQNEKASAGYYSVFLDKYGVLAEATATPHAGVLRITYPESDCSCLIFNFSRRIAGRSDFQNVKVISNDKIVGEIRCTPTGGGFGRGEGGIGYTLYFCCEFSKGAKKTCFFSDETLLGSFSEQSSDDLGLIAYFDTNEQESIVLRTGISYVDIEGAENNLHTEVTDFDFYKVCENAENLWRTALDCIRVCGENEEDKRIFYTCLYHTLLDPRINTDADGRYRDANKDICSAKNYISRTVFSGWDVYRSEFPLLTIIHPDTVNDEVNALIEFAEVKNSAFPRWELLGTDSGCMIGDPAVIVISDAFVKGIRNYDCAKAYAIAKASCLGEKTMGEKPIYQSFGTMITIIPTSPVTMWHISMILSISPIKRSIG